MTTPLPAAFSSLDIKRFALRAAQLEKVKPIIAYWCDYWIVNQILSKKLHDTDQECLVYTTNLMDKLEKFKSDNASEPAVTDDVAGKAYVEQFGTQTFERADNAVRANKASRQTADTYQAAATFFDLLQIWGELEPEVVKKIKYAKYHALRIAKAIKAGEDPNLSNPAPEPEPEEEKLPPLDPNDAEVQAIEGGQPESSIPQSNNLERQPSVADVPDEADRTSARLASQSLANESLHPSRDPSAPPPNDVSPIEGQDPSSFYTSQPGVKPDVSPLPSPSQSDRKSSVGGNYFPVVPDSTATQPDLPAAPTDPSLPSAPTTLSQPSQRPDLPHVPTHHHGKRISEPGSAVSPIDPPFSASSISSGAGQLPQPRGSHGPIPPVPPPHRQVQHQATFPIDPHSQVQPPALPPSAPSFTQNFTQPPPQAPPVQQPQAPPAPRAQAPLATSNLSSVLTTTNAAPPQPISTASAPVQVDEEAMMRAQKHARWAISALNFEDVPTAIRELREALKDLGG